MAETNLSKRTIKEGVLMKRCRWSWRPRFIEIISDPPDFTGPQYSFVLVIYDQSRRTVKRRIRVEDIVTIRAGKNCSFQVYLNNGMFILFRCDSMESQAAWMSELKMALGRGNIFHVQMSTLANSFVLDHALLYCIGVNLPNHHFGQLDRVLVVASPINDTNLHAWNLSRVKRFMVIEAGIQMDLCSNCMGHKKKTVTFVISPKFIQDCMDFLIKEARLSKEPKQMPMDGPMYYSVPHSCTLVTEGSTSLCENSAENIVLGKECGKKLSANVGLYINYDGRSRAHSTSTTTSSEPPLKRKPPTLQPVLPPRGITRVSTVKASSRLSNRPSDNHFNHLPYQINHRIYVNQNGILSEDSHVLGSGSWEHAGTSRNASKPPMIPPRFEDTTRTLPVYVHTSDIHSPNLLAHSPSFQRPEFIGRNPPCLPPRETHTPSPDFTKRSNSDSNLLGDSSPYQTRRNTEASISHRQRDSDSFTRLDRPPSYDEKLTYQNIPNSNGFDMLRTYSCNRSPSPQMCTDDITNAEFSMITTLKFSGNVLPPRTTTAGRRPVPLPRTKTTTATTPVMQCTSTLETKINVSEQMAVTTEEDGQDYSLNPMYALVGMERVTSSSGSSSRNSPVFLQKRISTEHRCNSFSSSNPRSDDFKRHNVQLMKQYSHEI